MRIRIVWMLSAGVAAGSLALVWHGLRAPARPPTTRKTGDVDSIEVSPQFRLADGAYRAHRFGEAATDIGELLQRPYLTPNQRAYLLSQRNICIARSGPLQPAPIPSAVQPNRNADCGPKALALVCRDLGVKADTAAIGRMAAETSCGVSMAGLTKAAQKLGLKAKGVLVTRQALGELRLPAIAWWMRRHFVEVTAIDGDEQTGSATIRDPSVAKERAIPREQLLEASGGYFLIVERR